MKLMFQEAAWTRSECVNGLCYATGTGQSAVATFLGLAPYKLSLRMMDSISGRERSYVHVPTYAHGHGCTVYVSQQLL